MTLKKRPVLDREKILEESRARAKERLQNRINDLSKNTNFLDDLKTMGIRKTLRNYPIDAIENLIPSNLDTDFELLLKIPETRQLISFYGLLKEKEILDFKKQISLALSHIKKSPVPFFSKVLELGGLICVGEGVELPRQSQSEKSIAFYSHFDDTIYYRKEKAVLKPAYITIIHEHGHKFHYNLIKNGNRNEKIINLYKQAIQPKECQLSKMPKIGDPLSDLREDWWTVKMASKDFILNKIDGDDYIYTQGKLKKIIKKQEILKLIHCPSQYGAKNVEEFFAEMCTLITLGLVKPSQKLITDKFMEIVMQEII